MQSGAEATVGGRPRSWFGLFWLSRIRLCMFRVGVVLGALVGLVRGCQWTTGYAWVLVAPGVREEEKAEKERKGEKEKGGKIGECGVPPPFLF